MQKMDDVAGPVRLCPHGHPAGARQAGGNEPVGAERERDDAFDDLQHPHCETVADFSAETAYDQVVRILSQPRRPTALLAASNLMALGALQAIGDLGFRCPEDLSLTGVDDVPWGHVVKPRLTIAAQPVDELARAATTFLLERMTRRGGIALPPRAHIALPRLVIGHSCAPPVG